MSPRDDIKGWKVVPIETILAPLPNGSILGQGWSPQCEKEPSPSENEWGVLRTTAIQAGFFLERENKRLPKTLEPRPHLEVKAGDLLITCAGPRSRCGVACLVRKTRRRLMISGKMYRFRTRQEIAASEFLEVYLQSREAWDAVDKMKTGGSDSGLNLTHERFKKLIIPLPPLPEQHRIVEKIEALFSELENGIEQLKTAQQQLKVYRQSVLKWAFEGKLTAEWRKSQISNPKSQTAWDLLERIKQERERQAKARGKKLKPITPLTEKELAELPELPREWGWARVEQIGDVQLGRQRSPKNVSNNFPTKYIRAANITEEEIDLADVLEMEFTPDERKRYELHEGDLVLSEASGSPDQVAKPAIWRKRNELYCFQNTVIRFHPFSVLPEYLLVVFRHYYYSGVFTRQAGGVGINHLSASRFSQMPLSIPPLREQHQIVQEIESRLSVCDKLEETIAASLQQSEALRQSILKKAFEGKLVPQDAKDEPVGVLVERIREKKS